MYIYRGSNCTVLCSSVRMAHVWQDRTLGRSFAKLVCRYFFKGRFNVDEKRRESNPSEKFCLYIKKKKKRKNLKAVPARVGRCYSFDVPLIEQSDSFLQSIVPDRALILVCWNLSKFDPGKKNGLWDFNREEINPRVIFRSSFFNANISLTFDII